MSMSSPYGRSGTGMVRWPKVWGIVPRSIGGLGCLNLGWIAYTFLNGVLIRTVCVWSGWVPWSASTMVERVRRPTSFMYIHACLWSCTFIFLSTISRWASFGYWTWCLPSYIQIAGVVCKLSSCCARHLPWNRLPRVSCIFMWPDRGSRVVGFRSWVDLRVACWMGSRNLSRISRTGFFVWAWRRVGDRGIWMRGVRRDFRCIGRVRLQSWSWWRRRHWMRLVGGLSMCWRDCRPGPLGSGLCVVIWPMIQGGMFVVCFLVAVLVHVLD